MLASLSEIRDRLARSVDRDGSVCDMASASDAISVLEKTAITKEVLEETRLGLYVNNIRRATRNSPLSKRAKNLIKTWQQMIEAKEPPFRAQRTRPETPNSVGSSPSPPEPPADGLVHSYSSPLLSRLHRSQTPTLDVDGKRSKKHKNFVDGKKSNKKIPSGSSTQELISLEVKGNKQSLDTGQSMLPNGIKNFSKAQSSMKSFSNPNLLSINNRSKSPSVSSQSDKLSVPKPHKRKRERKSPSNVPSPSPNTTSNLPQDVPYTESTKIKSSKSTPDFTVNKSPSAAKLSAKDGDISNRAINSSSPSPPAGKLKRKRDVVEDLDSIDDLRRAKERKLTYDPVTKQLKQVPSQVDSRKSSRVSCPSPEDLMSKLALKDDSDSKISMHAQKSSTKQNSMKRLSESRIKTEKNVTNKISDLTSEKHPVAVENSLSVSVDGLPSKIFPTVSILDDNGGNNFQKCDGVCSSSNFHEMYREFKKRKSRRKDMSSVDLASLYPLSKLAENLNSDSDENSSPEYSFSSTIKLQDSGNMPVHHSHYCQLPGVNGCRGNNGSWYDWTQMFCVRNHEGSEKLPDENEIMPLQILPYVELD